MKLKTTLKIFLSVIILLLFVSCSVDKQVDKFYAGMFNNIPLYDFYEFNPETATNNYFYDYLEYNTMIVAYETGDLNEFFKSIGLYIIAPYYETEGEYDIDVHVTYTSEINGQDNAQTPKITMFRRTGDCEDIALLFMNLAYVISNGEILMNLVLVDKFGTARTIVNGGIPVHAQVSYQGIIYETQLGFPVYNDIMYRYTFWEIFKR